MRFLTFVLFLCPGAFSFAQTAPELPFQVVLTTPDSLEVNSSAFWKPDGKPTVLAFWLTTCLPCQAELAAYAQHYAAWQREAPFRLFAVSLDFPERFRQVQTKARSGQWPFPVVWDRMRAFKELLPGGLNGFPQVFVFDGKGRLVWQHKGYKSGDEAVLFQKLSELAKP